MKEREKMERELEMIENFLGTRKLEERAVL